MEVSPGQDLAVLFMALLSALPQEPRWAELEEEGQREAPWRGVDK